MVFLRSKLPQVVIHVKVGVAHPLSPRQLTKYWVRNEFPLRTAELVKECTKFLDIRHKLNWLSTTLPLIHFRARLEAVYPWNRNPKRHGFHKGVKKFVAGLTYFSSRAARKESLR